MIENLKSFFGKSGRFRIRALSCSFSASSEIVTLCTENKCVVFFLKYLRLDTCYVTHALLHRALFLTRTSSANVFLFCNYEL